MPSPIPFVDRGKVEGDQWTTHDANLPPRASEYHIPALEHEHAANGEHILPAADAAGYAAWNPATSSYSWAWSRNLGSVIRRGVGRVEIQLARPMRTADHWIACAYPVSDEPVGAEEFAPFAKTQTTTQIQIYGPSQQGEDRSFLLLVYGVRL